VHASEVFCRSRIRSKSKKSQYDQGFTLIELLVSILILAIGIIGMMTLFPQSYSHIGNAGRLSVMNHLGQQKLDELKTRSYSDPDLIAGFHPTTAERITYYDSTGKNVYADYTIKWEVREDEPSPKIKTIIVEVGHQLYDISGNPIASTNAMHQKVIHFQAYVSK
jgi:prepilin-type N-terminal cleavage/methylation domain-containing protein